MKKYYCKHCNERIRQIDGAWLKVPHRHWVGPLTCSNNNTHEPR